MAVPTRKSSRIHHNNGGEAIIIERREVIGRVVPDPMAEHSMITAAMIQAGEWFTDNDDPKGAHIGFKFAGREFHLVLEPLAEEQLEELD